MPSESQFSSGYNPPALPNNDTFSQLPGSGDHESVLSGGGSNPVRGPNGTPVMQMSNCKRSGCPNPVRMMSNSGRPMPEYCSNDCLVEDNNKQMTNNPYANATTNWPPASGPQQGPGPQQTQQPEQSPNVPQGGSSPNSNPTNANNDEK